MKDRKAVILTGDILILAEGLAKEHGLSISNFIRFLVMQHVRQEKSDNS